MNNRYNIENENEVIREIQRYLLSTTPNEKNKGITQNGTWDEPTKEAILAFQLREGLEADGIVDLATWDLLWLRHLEEKKKGDVPCLPEIDLFDAQIGDTGYHIIILQTLLGEFSQIYPNTSRPAVTGQFGLTTADAVRAMQRNYGRYADGIVTPSLWNLMLRDHLSKKQIAQYNHIF